MADLEDKKVSQLESGTVTSNSVFLDSGNGVSTKVGSQDIANFVGKTHVFSDLNTTSKRLVGAINEVAGSAGKSNLADMDDVNIDDQTLEDGQGLVYDETNDKWVNGTVSGGASVVQKTMAEYTALPSADKMNGTIYKITDKALIYCLDEEYHAVKEITSADYALLSSAEKNNGTLYVITDEETTAADIPYSSGVSVADKLDSKQNVLTAGTGIDITSDVVSVDSKAITINANTGFTLLRSSGGKVGKLVGFSAIFGGSVSTATWTQVGTVDFKPTDEVYAPFLHTTTGVYVGMVNITTNGYVRVYAQTSTDRVAFSISYFSNSV